MEDQPGQPSSPYSQYPQYPSPTDPYGAGQLPYSSPNQPTYPGQSLYSSPNQPAYPGQPSYSSPNQPAYPSYPAQPPYSSPNQPAYPVPPQPYSYGGPGPNFQPPRQQKNYLWLIIVAAVLVVVLFGAVFAVVQSKNNSGPVANASTPTAPAQSSSAPTAAPTQQTNQPTQQPTASSTGTHKIGDVVSIDNWLVTVNGVKTSQGGQYDPPKAGNVYLEIDVSVTNQTGQSQTFSSLLSLTLKDSTGQKYDETFVSDAPSAPDGTVPNGSKLRGTVVYEVPQSMHSFEFDVAPESLTSTNVAVWNLSV